MRNFLLGVLTGVVLTCGAFGVRSFVQRVDAIEGEVIKIELFLQAATQRG